MRDGGEAPRFRRPKTIERSTGSYQKSKLSQCTSIDGEFLASAVVSL